MKVTNEPSMYLGMQICKSESGIFLNQSKYTEQILHKYNMSESKSVATPLAENTNADNEPGHTNFPYRETIGSLLYLTCKTRPDIA